MAMTEEQRAWAFDLINPNAQEQYEGLYPDVVEQIADYHEEPKRIVIVAIDDGNPPAVPLKQLAFLLEFSDDGNTELIATEIKLLNPEEVGAGQSRPQQFALHFPIGLMDRIAKGFPGDQVCLDCVPDPDLI